ncbi:MAG: tetratricopeptide repeat protein [Candidatus Schekmanbacteria bacterium]|nr:tetratricopeptide repeat protein [Candidatus Schekmanbacteria bacterium]
MSTRKQAANKVNNPKKVEVPAKTNDRKWLIAFLVLMILGLTGIVCYYPSFKTPFIFDDLRVIAKDRDIHIKALTLSTLQNLMKKSRSVAVISFALNYYYGGLDVFGFHAVNLLLHVLTALVIFLLADATLKLPSLASDHRVIAPAAAFFSALMFLVHPVNTQAVTYIVQRMCELAALFFLLSLFFYIQGRLAQKGARAIFYGLSALSGLLALGSKENAATLPVFIVLYEVYFFQGLDGKKLKKYAPYFLALIALPLIAAAYYFNQITSLHSLEKYTLTEKLLTELRVLFYYFSLLIFPHPDRLNLDYDYPLSHGLFNPPTTFLSLLGFCALVFLIFRSARKSPLLSFTLLWFIGNLIIESTIIPLEIIYEHRLYLPAVWIFVVFSCYAMKTIKKFNPHIADLNIYYIGLLLLITTTWGYWTNLRNLVWQDSFSIWQDVVKKSPDSGRAHDNLALAYFRKGDYAKAIAEHLEGIKLGGPGIAKKYNNLGNAYFKRHKLDEALSAYKKAVELDPNFAEARNGLGVTYNARGLYPEAEQELLKVLELEPHHPGAQGNLGMVYANSGQAEKAAQLYGKALAANPGDSKNRYGLAKAYAQKKLYPQAIKEYLALLKNEPKNPLIYNSLGSAFAESGKHTEAQAAFLQALALDSNFFKARKNLGNVYYLMQQNDKALEEWKKAQALNANDPVLSKNIEIVQRRLAASPAGSNQAPEAIKKQPHPAQKNP